jgi:hypothetical protein
MARIIRGRHIGRDIRWAMLARLWISDFHILYLPPSWRKTNRQNKQLKTKGNWVILELFYGRLLQKELRMIVGEPANDVLVEEFRQNIHRYTDEREIEQVDEVGWGVTVANAKNDLGRELHVKQFITCSPTGFDPAGWQRFKKDVLDPAGLKVINILADAWRYNFGAETWSVMQAMLMQLNGGDRDFTDEEVAKFILDASDRDPRYAWARQKNRMSAKKYMKFVQDRLKELADFRFDLYEGAYPPLLLVGARPVHVRLRMVSLHAFLLRKFSIESDRNGLQNIIAKLLHYRKE